MSIRFAAISDDELEDFRYAVTHGRRLPDNFEIHARPIARLPEGQICAIVDIVEVTYRPTGVRQSYEIGHRAGADENWLVVFAKDLSSGLFDGVQITPLALGYSSGIQMRG